MNKFTKFISAVGICFVAAGVGSIATFSQIPTWYTTIVKPTWNPPNWLFGPVWTLLYLLMAISLFLLWTNKNKFKTSAVNIFYIQLVLNVAWSWIFFGWHRLDIALIEIVVLWVAIIKTIIYSYKVNKNRWFGFDTICDMGQFRRFFKLYHLDAQ